jgi:hypothetical protein
VKATFRFEVAAPGAGRSSPDAWAYRPAFDDSFLLIVEVRISPAPGAVGLPVQWENKRCRDEDFSPGRIC